jgi:hypothetical protein
MEKAAGSGRLFFDGQVSDPILRFYYIDCFRTFGAFFNIKAD